MAEVKKKITKVKPTSLATAQDELNAIDKQITDLTAQKKELAKRVLKEMKAVKEVPLHQLNSIASLGVEKAKELLGDKWVS